MANTCQADDSTWFKKIPLNLVGVLYKDPHITLPNIAIDATENLYALSICGRCARNMIRPNPIWYQRG